MPFIDRDGLFSGERLAACSDLAQLYWPWFYTAANGYGRLELSENTIISKIFGNFAKPPEHSQLEKIFEEYERNYLVILYEVNGVWWAQFATREKYLPRYKTRKDQQSPGPTLENWANFQKGYISWKRGKSLNIHTFQKSAENFGMVVVVEEVSKGLSTSSSVSVNPPFPKPNSGAAAPRGGSSNPPSPGKPTPSKPPPSAKQSKTKAKLGKPAKSARRRIAKGGNDETGTAGANKSGAGGLGFGVGHLKKQSSRPKADFPADSRWEPFRIEIFRYWDQQNMGDEKAGNCPWTVKDQAALSGLLRASPEMTLETFRGLLMNRARSEVVASDPPRNWLAGLKLFAGGPLDRYRHSLRPARVL
jgi:hypothetical protein